MTRYFVVQQNPISFGLAATPDGAEIDITSAGSGTHSFTVVGSGQYLPQSTYAVGIYNAWILLVGATTAIVPEKKYGFQVEVLELGN